MTTIIATIKPYYARMIRTGKKKYEIRRNLPQNISQKVGEKGQFRVLLCESGSGGKITGEFICDEWTWFYPYLVDDSDAGKQFLKDCCLEKWELVDYGKNHAQLCAWHIMEATDYCSTKGHRVRNISEFGLKRAPQSWQYVKEEP